MEKISSDNITAANRLRMKLRNSKFLQKARALYLVIDKILFLFIRKPSKNDGQKKQVLYLSPASFGDCIIDMGLVVSLREIFPKEEYELSIACNKAYQSLFSELFDKVIPVDFGLMTFSIKKRIEVFKKLRSEYYDAYFDLTGSNDYDFDYFCSRAVCAKEKCCAVNGLLNQPNGKISDKRLRKIYDKVFDTKRKGHLCEFYADVLSEYSGKNLKWTIPTFSYPELDLDLPEKYAIVFPSGSFEDKNWPVERFAEITDRINTELKLPVVLCGTVHDQKWNDKLKELPSAITVDVTGKTNCNQFLTLMKNAEFVVTNDTSTYHAAVLASTRVYITANGASFDAFVKYPDGFSNIIINKEMECYYCRHNCKYKFDKCYPCLEAITVDDVWTVIKQNEKLVNDDE